VIWCDWIGDGAIYIANADGSARKKIVTLLPHPDPVFADMKPELPLPPRITADAGQVYFLHNHRDPRGTGVWRVNADGSSLTQVFNFKGMAQKLFGRDVGELADLAFADGFDISANGARVIVGTRNFKLEQGDRDRGDAILADGGTFYHVGEYAIVTQPFATNKDGNQFMMFKREFNPTAQADEINVYFVPAGTGDPVKVVGGLDIFGVAAMTQMAGDGSHAIILGANGRLPISLVDRVSASRRDLVSIDGISLVMGQFRFSESILPSINWNGDRFCFLASSNPPQIWLASINSNAVLTQPAITEISFNPDFVLVDGSTTATFKAHVTRAPHTIKAVMFEAFSNGALQYRALKSDWPYQGMLVDTGEFGDEQAGDGYFCNNSVRADLPETPVGTYSVRLSAVNTTLRQVALVDAEPFSIRVQPTAVHSPERGLPAFQLAQNYPNPFNATTRITYSIPRECQVEIKIFDLLGNEIQQLVNEFQHADFHSVNFDAHQLASVMYFYQIKACDFVATRKLLLIR